MFGILRTNMSIILGEISDSIYLAHEMVLYFLVTMLSSKLVASMPESVYMFYMLLVGVSAVLIS
jgi:peptidoglycan/LPS O-acetylase OafA/YrhL